MTSEIKIEQELGDNLNNFSGLTVLEADDPESLASLIRKIRCQISIVQIVAKGNRIYAFVNANRPLKKKKQ